VKKGKGELYHYLRNKAGKIFVNADDIVSHMKGLSKVGVPYTDADYSAAKGLVSGKTEGDALVAYLMKLGKDYAEFEKSRKAEGK